MDREKEQTVFKKYTSLLEKRKEEKLIDKCLWLESALSKYTKDKLQIVNNPQEYIDIWESYLLILGYCDLIYSNQLGYSIGALLEEVRVKILDGDMSLKAALALSSISLRLYVNKRRSIVPEELEKWVEATFEWRETLRNLVILNRTE